MLGRLWAESHSGRVSKGSETTSWYVTVMLELRQVIRHREKENIFLGKGSLWGNPEDQKELIVHPKIAQQSTITWNIKWARHLMLVDMKSQRSLSTTLQACDCNLRHLKTLISFKQRSDLIRWEFYALLQYRDERRVFMDKTRCRDAVNQVGMANR